MVSVLTLGGLYFLRRFWVKGGCQYRANRRAAEAVSSASNEATGNMKELEYFGEGEAECGKINRVVIISFPSYEKGSPQQEL